jgi:two-component system nitrogen regulation response regulator GlnG
MTSSHTVLVVDDAAAIRLLCRVNLELDGHAVREAGNLGAARDALADGLVSLVLLDVHVGHEDGLAFLEELRREHPGLRVAMLTGSADLDRVREMGPDAVLGKPFELDQLREVVDSLASRRAGV